MPASRLDAAVTLPGEDFSRVALTEASVDLLRRLWRQHGQLMFHQWSHTHLTVDVVQGRGSGFSVEAPEGKRFLIRSALMDWPV